MEDRLKFRVYSKAYKKYFYNVIVYSPSHFAYEVTCAKNTPTFENRADKKDIIEQCTGLKDRKGNLIYEGDIVTKLYITPDGRVTSENDPNFIKEITFFKGCFGIFGKTNFHPIIEYIDYHQGEYIPNEGAVTIYDNCFLKVIGNIHKTPELLKELVNERNL